MLATINRLLLTLWTAAPSNWFKNMKFDRSGVKKWN
jgi:hypothetical protein